MLKRFLLVAAVLCLAAPAEAQGWPTRTVRLIVNIAPGGIGDVVARVIGKSLSDTMDQQFIVENWGDGTGYVGAQAVAAAAPDEYTFLVSAGSTMLITPHIVGRTNFIPVDELLPVAPTVRTTLTLIVHSNFPAEDFKTFIDYAKANPGKVNYGSAGTGTGLHIAGEMLRRSTGADFLHVPFRGAGPALNDLLGGHVDFMFDPGVGREHTKAGRVKLLATTSSARLPDFPNAPTFTELGVDVHSGPYFGFYAPKGVASEIVLRLNAEIGAAIKTPDVRQRLEAMGLEITTMPPAEFATYVKAQNLRYAALVKELGIKQ
jgi:tripartite-type tricarboxylate transporter receptor subunit TctC